MDARRTNRIVTASAKSTIPAITGLLFALTVASAYGQEEVAGILTVPATSVPAASLPEEAEPRQFSGSARANLVVPSRDNGPLVPETAQEVAADDDGPRPSSFNGISPGISSRSEVTEAWGQPVKSEEDGHETFEVHPFKSITVAYDSGHVASIIVDMESEVTAEQVAGHLDVSQFRPAVVPDEQGRAIGVVYPERGILLHFGNEVQPEVVTQVILEPLSGHTFLLRAEQNLRDNYTSCLADLKQAAMLLPEDPYVQWLQAKVQMEAGRYHAALTSANKACELDAMNPEYLLVKAEAHARLADFDSAIDSAKEAAKIAGDNRVIKARAEAQLGDHYAASPQRDYKLAIQHHTKAIELAAPYSTHEQVAIRRAALEVLLDAHLAVADDIARGAYKRKPVVVPIWIKEAEKVAEELVETEGGSPEYQFRLACGALTAIAGSGEDIDVDSWASQAVTIGRKLVDATEDPLRKNRLEWDLGLALYDALQACHGQKKFGSALNYGTLAVTYLERSAEQMEEVPSQSFLLGRMNYRIGAIYAVAESKHDKAVLWFEKAIPLMLKPITPSAYADYGTQGETLVSMAISYWQGNYRKEALTLTQQGAELIERAVQEGSLDEKALQVAYGNLATMHGRLGNESEAEDFAAMAKALNRTSKQK